MKPKRKQNGDETGSGPFSRRFLRIQDLTLGLAALVACLGFFLFQRNSAVPGATALVTLNGEEIRSVPLSDTDDYRIDLAEEYGVPVSFEVRGGEIRFVDVTCPDHICEKTGFVSREGQTAVCMPNRVAVHIVG